ncbi:MAG TPA: glycosyltransferase family 4 protein [Roseiflexaceae bacterium]|nr:glycosyltransferase family 4 protein [Roseiflexaceae bacterium]
MRIASFLFDELDVNDFRPATHKPFVSGRSLLTKWIVEAMVAHPAVAELAVCGTEEPPLAGTSAVPFPQIGAWLAQGDAVWFEPARHYWWRPGLVRQTRGRTFPIVTMMHSLGFGFQFQPLILSLVTPPRPGDTVIAPSEHAAEVFRHQCENIAQVLELDAVVPNTIVIPYGVPPVPHVPRETARAVLGWDDTPVVLFVGRLSYRYKADFDALFEAAARLVSKDVAFKLVIAGSDAERQSEVLRARAVAYGVAACVEVIPNISEIDKHVLLGGCDLFVSPSDTTSESFGLSIVEAMLHGRAVVCTSWSGYKEIVRDGIDGFLIDTWWNERSDVDMPFVLQDTETLSSNVAIDIVQLTARLADLLLDSEKRQAMGAAGKARAESMYLIDNTVKQIVAYMEQSARQFLFQDTTSKKLSFGSILGRYASKVWTGKEYLQADPALDLARLLRAGSPQDLMLLKNDCLNHLRPGHSDERFRLLRRGSASIVTGHDGEPLNSGASPSSEG